MPLQQFDSFEEVMAEISRQQRVADGHLLLWQEQIAPGDYAVLLDDDVIVYAAILPLPADYWPAPPPNYRFTQGFSVYEPAGEYGAIHAAGFSGVITGAQFERARERGWPGDHAGFRGIVVGDPRWGAPAPG